MYIYLFVFLIGNLKTTEIKFTPNNIMSIFMSLKLTINDIQIKNACKHINILRKSVLIASVLMGPKFSESGL